MKREKIIYIVPYFGKMREDFNLWLLSVRSNLDINWLIITDDKSSYNYPENVKVIYMTFDELRTKIQKNFNFKITLDTPYKICDYRVAYGEIFKQEIDEYDFWGYCDLDMIWGNIRTFITDDILQKYDKIGFQGHSTLYRNCEKMNQLYKKTLEGKEVYKECFSTNKSMFFDEEIITKLCREYNIPFYSKTIFAHISPLTYNFYLRYFPLEVDYKNKYQCFVWNEGNLYRKYVFENKIYTEEFMYVHFLKRKMKVKFSQKDNISNFIMIPNSFIQLKDNLSVSYIKRKTKNNMLLYYIELIYVKRKKMNLSNIVYYLKCRRIGKKQRKFSNDKIY